MSRTQRRERRATRPAAYESARELCALVGPLAIAVEYDLAGTGTDEQIARDYAQAAYIKEARKAAQDGALAGFEDFRETN